MNIILLGYRGTGKSVISRKLAHRLSRPLFSIDRMVTEQTQKSIPEIVSDGGWPRFRELESEIVRQVAEEAKDAVIDCGGGVVLNEENIRNLRRTGKTVLLKADDDVLLKRLRKDKNRPPLKDGLTFEEEQMQVMKERRPLYEAAADWSCDTSVKTIEETVHDMIHHFKEHSWI